MGALVPGISDPEVEDSEQKKSRKWGFTTGAAKVGERQPHFGVANWATCGHGALAGEEERWKTDGSFREGQPEGL